MLQKEEYNQLPRPTFRWMKVNHLELATLPSVATTHVEVPERHTEEVQVDFYKENRIPSFSDFEGANPRVMELALHQHNTGCQVTIGAQKKGSVWLHYTVDDKAPQIHGQLYVKAGAHSELNVFITFDGDAEDGEVNLFQYIEAAVGAKVQVSKLQLHGDRVRHIDHRLAKPEQQAYVEFDSVDLGGKEVLVYYKGDLAKDEGECNIYSTYIGAGKQLFDFSYVVPTAGVKTKTDILNTGALMETAKKYFRGTIDFLRGGKKAFGSESDVCLLLSPTVHSISIPLLLCKEDDVVGNHASSAGQIDKDMLFYLMSRGFDEAGAQLILVESNVRPIIDKLGDAEMEEKALQSVRDKMQICYKKGELNA